MKSVGEILHFNFGTAVGGVYTIKIKISCKVDLVNIAYAIAEDYSISNYLNISDRTNYIKQNYQFIKNKILKEILSID